MSTRIESKGIPRVLIVNGQSIYKENGTGITLQSLFSSWRKDNLLEVVVNKSIVSINADQGKQTRVKSVCVNRGLIYNIATSHRGQKANLQLKNGNTSTSKLRKIKSRIRELLVCLSDCSKVKINRKTWIAIKEFAPEIIYTLGGSVATLTLVYRLSKRFNIPVIIHFMDNWVECMQWEENPLLIFYRKKINRLLQKSMKHSTKGICISEEMAEAYFKKFKIPMEVLMNSVPKTMISSNNMSATYRKQFVYAGGLHLGRNEALLQVARAIQFCNEKNKTQGQLNIYTGVEGRKLFQKEFEGLPVCFYDSVDHKFIWEILKRADILLHVESQNLKVFPFIKYSISTKIPEYLATGKLILYYGPRSTALYKYLKGNDVALVADNFDVLCLKVEEAMIQLDFSRIQIAAVDLCKKRHMMENNCEKLKRIFVQAIEEDKRNGGKK